MLGKRLYESPIIKPVSSIKHFQTCSKSNNKNIKTFCIKVNLSNLIKKEVKRNCVNYV